MAIILLAVAVWTKTHADKLSTRWLNRIGFAPNDLWFWRWERLFTSALVTSGGQLFWPLLTVQQNAVHPDEHDGSPPHTTAYALPGRSR